MGCHSKRRVEGVMLRDGMTLAKLKESIRARLKMGSQRYAM
ncbi:uncharacterized protein G2W53_033038 [Senna tora]|uniref:Ubiquitin-like domain-containing protein n=1 Tax=Senna tora TaxID=362788 RepID=A0A834W7I6_9FABA|nr:uncharacterized protein G2W53_033038 [Senna tora]